MYISNLITSKQQFLPNDFGNFLLLPLSKSMWKITQFSSVIFLILGVMIFPRHSPSAYTYKFLI